MTPHDRLQRALALFAESSYEDSRILAEDLLQEGHYPAETEHLLAAILHSLGESDKAIHHVRQSILHDSSNPSYLNTYGVILRKLKRTAEAIRAYQCVTSLQPDFADVYYNCGNAYMELKQLEAAVEQFKLCLRFRPDHNSAHHNMANALRDLKLIDDALDHYRRSDEFEHHNPDMHCNWGLAWQLKERWENAIQCFQVAIQQKTDHVPAHINLGSALAVQERFTEACEALRRGVQLDATCLDAKFNLGLTLLTIGELDEGWHFYDTRLDLPDKVRSPLSSPIWDGSLELDSPLLVWAEQGYGDNIQFIRYIPILMELGLDLVVSTRKPLMQLFQHCLQPSAPPIIEHKPSELQGFKHHVPLLTLPRLLRTNLATIPRLPGYLKLTSPVPDSLRVVRHPFALQVGLVWASGVDNKDMYADKSMSLDLLMPALQRWRASKLISVQSLQVGIDAIQIQPWLEEWGVTDWSNRLNSFLDTAIVVSQLDLVITVDTAVAHIAGALNKPTWLLLQHNADFRWLRGREDSPWYPSMTLLRQSSLGNWSSVVNQVSERLTRLLG